MPSRIIHDEAKRKHIYRVVIATIPLLVILGVLTEEVAGQVALIAAAVLGVGASSLADANTEKRPHGE